MVKWAWQTAVTDNATTNKEDPSLQRIIRWERGNKAYLWVKNTHGVAMALGDVVYRDVTDLTTLNAAYLGDANTNADGMLGVVTSTNGITIGGYGWVQVYGVNASILTRGVVAVNEVQTVTPTTASSAGFWSIEVPNPSGGLGSTGPLAYTATLATTQTALDLATGVANGIVLTTPASAAPMSPAAMTFTFSGTGYAALPWTTPVRVNTSAITGTTKVLNVRTTPGVRASAIGDTLAAVSGTAYCSTVERVGVTPPVKRYIESLVTYATATNALKTGFIHCLQ